MRVVVHAAVELTQTVAPDIGNPVAASPILPVSVLVTVPGTSVTLGVSVSVGERVTVGVLDGVCVRDGEIVRVGDSVGEGVVEGVAVAT